MRGRVLAGPQGRMSPVLSPRLGGSGSPWLRLTAELSSQRGCGAAPARLLPSVPPSRPGQG